MALGQTSLFIATRVGQHHLAHKHAHHYLTIGAGATDAAVLQATDRAPRPARPPRPWDPIVVRSQALLMRGRSSVSHRMVTHPRRIIFGLSVIPNPLTTFATVTASAVGVSFTHFFAASLAGFLVLTSALVILGQGMLQALRVAS